LKINKLWGETVIIDGIEGRLQDAIVFAGTDDEEYVDDVCKLLGLDRGNMEFKYHGDGDPYLRLLDNVMGKDVFFVLRYHKRTVHNWMQILSFANAALNESANSVNVFETYLGCSRQERKSKPGEAVTLQAKVCSIMSAGVKNFSSFAAHTDATILAFDPSRTRFTNFPLWPAMVRVIYSIAGDDVLIKTVSPDAGGAKQVREILNSTTVREDSRFEIDLAIVDKDRVHQKGSGTKSGALIGDVEDVIAALFDDESVTAGSICDAARICCDGGARGTYVGLAHSKFVMDEKGISRMKDAMKKKIIQKLILTNSCYIPENITEMLGLKKDSDRLIVIPTQPLVAEYIRRSVEHKGMPYLFSSRGVLRPYKAIRNYVESVETGERSDNYDEKFMHARKLYARLAEPVLGPYRPVVKSHGNLIK